MKLAGLTPALTRADVVVYTYYSPHSKQLASPVYHQRLVTQALLNKLCGSYAAVYPGFLFQVCFSASDKAVRQNLERKVCI